ncbi:MAG TPA: metalloregulator ArsR/SmtB family transcription factor [Xanthobacteraceae bacterium]
MARLFHAMGDKTRLGIVARLARGPATVTDLSRGASMALPSFLQHLNLLEECSLIRSEKVGRVRVCRLEPRALSAAERWIESQRSAWANRLDALEDYLAEKVQQKPKGRRS